ncbi:hypothetical protein L6J37_01770 [Photobacterium sp. WH77]|uniref:Uncharacterized protein n=2 Tax=Photobacterium TaxID=657 RepID=A0A7X5ASK9_9GAMM|nr:MULTISPECIES: hypothetical protein [Photobacterium]MBD8514303.1 hypothetical protein [Photobacterium arenosum]MBV7260470.1 hypothetical protein [Photobacterium sp. WH24]MCG2835589.1 hypothetical protein [Photobacterium sp. WH77]MCG2843202.1 hypothetical protein [Photobacterium sp. WH80]MDO6580927.1 hypothetical protein [Photobacterium sp. 2_MG-2023]
MKVRLDPIALIVVSILLGWGWTEVTTEPVCQQEMVQQGVRYTIPIKCSDIPNVTVSS